MIQRIPATRKQIVQVVLFLVLAAVPLFLIPFFPQSLILQTLGRNGIAILALVVSAGCISALVTSLIYRDRK